MFKNKLSGDTGEQEVVEKVPPLIINFKWSDKTGDHQEIRFYRFIPKKNLKMHKLSPIARRANYKMFNYVRIDTLPYFVLYEKL